VKVLQGSALQETAGNEPARLLKMRRVIFDGRRGYDKLLKMHDLSRISLIYMNIKDLCGF
jgi:hypothetical protein